MNKVKLFIFAAVFMAAAFTFNSCGEAGGGGGDGGGDQNSSSSGDDETSSGESSSSSILEPDITTACDPTLVDTLTHFCYRKEGATSDSVAMKCSGEKYNPDIRFCFDNKFYFKCTGREYNPIQYFCFKSDGEEKISLRCGNNSKPVDPDEEFCFDGDVKIKCENRTKIYNPREQFCFEKEDKLYDLCGDSTWIPGEQFCERLTVLSKCDGKVYNPKDSVCFDKLLYSTNCTDKSAEFCDNEGVNYKVCINGGNSVKYNIEKEFCTSAKSVRDLCEGEPYDIENEFCPEENGYTRIPFCVEVIPGEFGSPPTRIPREYKPSIEECNGGKVVPRVFPKTCNHNPDTQFCCLGKVYNKSEHPDKFCQNDEILLPKCPKDGVLVEYPSDTICFKGTELKPSCSSDNPITGPCAFNTNQLRCRQLGNKGGVVEDYIIDPLPGMECQPNGAITGKIVIQNSLEYRIAQIGKQIWTAENLKSTSIFDDNATLTTIENYEDRYTISDTVFKRTIITTFDSPNTIDTVMKDYKDIRDFNESEIDTVFGGHEKNSLADTLVEYAVVSKKITEQKSREKTETVSIPIPIGRHCNNNSGCLYTLLGPLEPASGYEPSAGYASDYYNSIDISSSISSSCPQGFRFPSVAEWRELIEYAGGEGVAGGRLKDSTSWGYGSGTDSYGFNAKPSGYEVRLGTTFLPLQEGDTRSLWWALSSVGTDDAYYYDMTSADTEVRTHYRPKDGSAAIRCVRDAAF